MVASGARQLSTQRNPQDGNSGLSAANSPNGGVPEAVAGGVSCISGRRGPITERAFGPATAPGATATEG